jgi:hypothetical protein
MKLITFEQMFNGLHWVFKNNQGEELSIICHDGSYGWANGLFETRCSWLTDVQGHLTFEQVARKIKTLERRENNKENKENDNNKRKTI